MLVYNILKIQKRMIRLIANLGVRDSCHCVFKELGILHLYHANTDVHSFGTRYKNYLHLPSAKLKVFQRGNFYSGIAAYNHLPKNKNDLSYDVKRFKQVLKTFFQTHSFYSLEEYLNLKFDLNFNSQL
jgi:hypothetical protein